MQESFMGRDLIKVFPTLGMSVPIGTWAISGMQEIFFSLFSTETYVAGTLEAPL